MGERRIMNARYPLSSPYGAYTNPMNDIERRMDNVNLSGRLRNPPVGDYNRKQTVTHAPGSQLQYLPFTVYSTVRITVLSVSTPIAPPSLNMGVTNLGYPPAPTAGYPPSNYPLSGHGPDIYRAPSPSPSPYHGAPEPAIISPFLRAASPNPMGVSGV